MVPTPTLHDFAFLRNRGESFLDLESDMSLSINPENVWQLIVPILIEAF